MPDASLLFFGTVHVDRVQYVDASPGVVGHTRYKIGDKEGVFNTGDEKKKKSDMEK